VDGHSCPSPLTFACGVFFDAFKKSLLQTGAAGADSSSPSRSPALFLLAIFSCPSARYNFSKEFAPTLASLGASESFTVIRTPTASAHPYWVSQIE